MFNLWQVGSALLSSVDGRNPAIQLRLVVYPIIYRVLYTSGGARFLPSTVGFAVCFHDLLCFWKGLWRTGKSKL